MDTKLWYQSQTIWGALFAALGVGVSLFGYQVVPGAEQEVTNAVGQVVSAVGAVWAIVGRFKAGGIVIKRP